MENVEIKTRLPVWLYPSTIKKMDSLLERTNSKSQSEFMEKAIHFYAGFISTGDSEQFLSKTMVSVIKGTIEDFENRVARMLFKHAVEVSMMMNVLASGLEISEDDLRKLRGKCINDVKRTNGMISFDEAIKFQKGV